jgi:hypothetical protein
MIRAWTDRCKESTMALRSILRSGALLLVFAIVPSCTNEVAVAPEFAHTLNAVLDGSQVVPGVAVAASGTAAFQIDGLQTKVRFTINLSGVGTVSSVKIHAGEPGSNGPELATLASGPVSSPLTGTLTAFSGLTLEMLGGRAYVIVRTVANPNGEIRGHIGPAQLASARLSGAQMVGPVATAASGSATLSLDEPQGTILVTLSFTGIVSPTSAHLHAGKAGTVGPAVFNLSTVPFSPPLTVMLTAADFMPGGGLLTFNDALAALLSGRLNIDVHSAAAPIGEIRGQVGPAQLNAALNGANVNPANTSTATGSATLSLGARQDVATVVLTHDIPAAHATGVQIHAEAAGNNGPTIFDVGLAAGTAASPIEAQLSSLLLIPQPLQSVTTFPEAVDAFLTSRTYIDVETTGFSAGEIRGQFVP